MILFLSIYLTLSAISYFWFYYCVYCAKKGKVDVLRVFVLAITFPLVWFIILCDYIKEKKQKGENNEA